MCIGVPLGKIIGTTISENEKLLKDVLDLSPTVLHQLIFYALSYVGIPAQHSEFSVSVPPLHQLSHKKICPEKPRNPRISERQRV